MTKEVTDANTAEVELTDLEADTEYIISIAAFTVSSGDLPANETFVVKTFVTDGKLNEVDSNELHAPLKGYHSVVQK